ncbi:hypothetical protein T12_7983 [Trichinella patagoniensis]|uniref:Uncharacterized protein n=1 Tax=Trichinella patagoniensis TaxID=990121 RepID=A0A0V1ABF0_9BILA|nr:hypothetical protein T12_7983 [Trichinella patagoniensis]
MGSAAEISKTATELIIRTISDCVLLEIFRKVRATFLCINIGNTTTLEAIYSTTIEQIAVKRYIALSVTNKIQDIECDPLHDWVICSIGGRFQLSLFWRAAFPSRVPLFKINFKFQINIYEERRSKRVNRVHRLNSMALLIEQQTSHFRVCGGKFMEPVKFTCAHDLHNL